MATSRKGLQHPLSHLTAQSIAPLDVRDDRLRHRLQHVRKPASWHAIARDLPARRMEIDALSQDGIRCEATTVSGAHEVTAGGRGQCGQRQDEPPRPQITGMMGALDPLGMPRATEVLSGERADEGGDIPLIERIRTGWKTIGLFFVGDGKRSALDTRASLARPQAFSLAPLPLTGATAEAMDAWIPAGVTQGEAGAGPRIGRTHDRGPAVLAAEGDACERPCGAPVGKAPWRVRGGVRSPLHATHQAAGGETRLRHAETTLAALTPPRGRGKRHITDEATLVEAMDLVLPAPRVDGWLRVTWEKQDEQTTQYVGRGRGSGSRAKRVIQPTRDPITPIARQQDPIAALRPRLGWKAFVTKAEHTPRSVPHAVLGSRNAYRVERLCHRRKSGVHIAPLCVKLNEHMEGLTSLLTLGVRVCTVTELVLRWSLEKEQARLPGWHPENKHKRTNKPAAERILQAFAAIARPIIKHAAGEDILRRLTPLSAGQEDILQRLGFGASLYEQLEMQEMGNGWGEWGV